MSQQFRPNTLLNTIASEVREVQLIDDFMVLGAVPEQLHEEELVSLPSTHLSDKSLKTFEPVEAQNIFSTTHDLRDIDKCPRRKVIKNFCFPDDVKVSRISSFEQARTLVLEQHFNTNDFTRVNLKNVKVPYTFNFSLNKTEESKRKSSTIRPIAKSSLYDQDMVMPEDERHFELGSTLADQDETDMLTYNFEAFMYCICFRFNCLLGTVNTSKLSQYELDTAIKQGRVYITERCFCVLFSTNVFYNLQGQFLMKLYQAYSL